ncbi:MAG TPA: DUF4184 family protein [Ohtaekwangia sp.]|uniref:DUF4184 family protein n=1 Tax=Ohtaekwangia sp. TaxID=2066019 RepID=UPI002F94711F
MPFTPAHPAIVLPFLRTRKLSATALVIGSMAPDFEYFFKLSVDSEHSHTLWGLLYFDLPVVFFLSLLFHLVVKQNLIRNLPYFFQQRFQDTLNFDLAAYIRSNYIWFILSALLGSASHLFWDAFTHASGFFARELPFYEGTVVPFDGVRYPLFYALQHISTVIGLTLVAACILLRKEQPVSIYSRPSVVYWLSLMLITAGVVVVRFMIYSADYNLGNVVVSSISGVCIALVVNGMLKFRSITTA